MAVSAMPVVSATWFRCRRSLRVRFNGNGAVFTHRAVNGLHRGDVAQSLHAIRFRVAVATNAVREGIEFQNELVDHFELLLEPSALNLAKESAFLLEGECGV